MEKDSDFILREIPDIFLPDYKENFDDECCSICGSNLLEKGYMVEKAFDQDPLIGRYEEVFSIIVCFDCADRLNSEMSKESMEKIEKFRQERFLMDYHEKLIKNENFNISKWLKYCEITHQKVRESTEFNIIGFFFDDMMFYRPHPMAVTFEGLQEIDEIYSQKTKDIIDDFYSALPPEIRDKVKDRLLI